MESANESSENSLTGSKTTLSTWKSYALKTKKTGSNDKLTTAENVGGIETLVERLNLLHTNNPYRAFDNRSLAVRQNIEEKFNNTPKTTLEQAEDAKPEIEKRLEDTDQAIGDLLAFGNELITNIKVANEKRQSLRQEFESNQRIDLESGISRESTETMARYNDIVSRWSELGELQEPMIMFDKLQEQKDRVIELLRNKDDMIAKCQHEIERIDESFERELYEQQASIRLMVERVNSQIDLLKKAYSHQFNLLEDTLESERQTIALKEQEKWKEFYHTGQRNERFKLDMTKEKKDFYTNEIQRIMAQQEEITRLTRIRLEKDAEMLLYDLRCTKNRVIINSEKLDYNYQVLQKRNDENVIINNQQKRRVGKLNESLVELKKRIKSTQANNEMTITKLSNDIQKLHELITDLEQKNNVFHTHNRKKFIRIWDTNFDEMKTLIERVFDIDRILHEQQLCLPWEKPALDLEELDLVKKEKAVLFGGLNSSDSDYSIGNDSIVKEKNQIEETSSFALRRQEQEFKKRKRDTLLRKAGEEQKHREQMIEKRLLRNILRKVADLGGFLVEDRVLKFLEPYTKEEKTLVRIDNIFAALHITDMAAVDRLVEFFKVYAWCPNCSKGISREKLKKLYHPCKLTNTDCFGEDDEFSHADNSFDSMGESVSTNNKTADHVPRATTETQIPQTCNNHYLIIESSMVLTALSEFTNQDNKLFEEESKRYSQLRSSKAISASSRIKSKPSTSLIGITDAIITEYWRKFQDYMPQEKLKLWQTLEHGLTHYLDILKQREQLDKDCNDLRRQNAELKHLLKKFKV